MTQELGDIRNVTVTIVHQDIAPSRRGERSVTGRPNQPQIARLSVHRIQTARAHRKPTSSVTERAALSRSMIGLKRPGPA